LSASDFLDLIADGHVSWARFLKMPRRSWFIGSVRKPRIRHWSGVTGFTKRLVILIVWLDYSAIEIVPNHFLTDIRNSIVFEGHRNIDKIGKPVDAGEWNNRRRRLHLPPEPTAEDRRAFSSGQRFAILKVLDKRDQCRQAGFCWPITISIGYNRSMLLAISRAMVEHNAVTTSALYHIDTTQQFSNSID
jgi:hypothetical protein